MFSFHLYLSEFRLWFESERLFRVCARRRRRALSFLRGASLRRTQELTVSLYNICIIFENWSLGWTLGHLKHSLTKQYRVFSRDVTAAMLVSPSKGTAAMSVSPTNLPGIKLYSHANVSFVLFEKHVYWSYEWKHSIQYWAVKKTWITAYNIEENNKLINLLIRSWNLANILSPYRPFFVVNLYGDAKYYRARRSKIVSRAVGTCASLRVSIVSAV